MARHLEDFTAGEAIEHWPGRIIRDFDDTCASTSCGPDSLWPLTQPSRLAK